MKQEGLSLAEATKQKMVAKLNLWKFITIQLDIGILSLKYVLTIFKALWLVNIISSEGVLIRDSQIRSYLRHNYITNLDCQLLDKTRLIYYNVKANKVN